MVIYHPLVVDLGLMVTSLDPTGVDTEVAMPVDHRGIIHPPELVTTIRVLDLEMTDHPQFTVSEVQVDGDLQIKCHMIYHFEFLMMS